LKHSIFLLLSLAPVVAWAALPPDARSFLNQFPDKALHVDAIVMRGLTGTNQVKRLEAQAAVAPAARLKARALLDAHFELKGAWNENKNEPATPFSPTESGYFVHSLGVNTQFRTGTALTAELSHGSGSFQMPRLVAGTAFDTRYYESKASLLLTQNLWQDSFGRSLRQTLKAGDLGETAGRLAVHEAVEDMVQQYVSAYYEAWLAKSELKAAEENRVRRERLAKTMGLKLKRGTAERPDVIQAQSALTGARLQETEALQHLYDIWVTLVLSLDLPEHWLKIDPREIPLQLTDPVPQAQSLCRIEAAKQPATVQLKRLELEARGRELLLHSAKDRLRPDLELFGGVVANGIDTDTRTESLSEAQKFSHPSWTVGLSLKMPLSGALEESQYREAVAEKARADIALDQARDDFRRNWLSLCANLDRGHKAALDLKEVWQNQAKRSRLEEARFSMGRSPILNVVQAGDDATASETRYHAAEAQSHLLAWKIERLADGFRRYLTKLKMEAYLQYAPAD
jgi:outer membrane protein TolC